MVLGLSCDEIKMILVASVVLSTKKGNLLTKIEINLEFSKAFVRGIIVCA